MKAFKYDKNGNTPKGDWTIADYYEPPEEMLKYVDKLLKKFHLQVVVMEDNGSTYTEFSIIKRKK